MLFSIDRDTITTIANPACGCCKSSAKKAKCFIAITAQLNALGEAVFRLNDRETKRLHDIVIKSTEHFWELVSREVMYTQTGNRSKVRGFLRMAAQFQAAGVKAPPYIGLDAHSRLGKMTPRLKALRQLDGNPFTGRLDVHWDSKYVLESAVGQKFADELSQLGLARTLHAIAQCESGTLDLSADRAADGVLGTGLRPEDFWVTKKTLLEWSARYHGSRQREHWDAFNSEPSFERLAPHAIAFLGGFRYGQHHFGLVSIKSIGLTMGDIREAISYLHDKVEEKKQERKTARYKAQAAGRKYQNTVTDSLVQELYEALRTFETEWRIR